MRLSIITVVYNGEAFISDCIRSVLIQTYQDVEYIIVDGGSTDGTIECIKSFGKGITTFISQKDLGIYDAMNKGIAMATGNVIGILNADDFFSDEYVLENIARAFKGLDSDVVYGDLFYISRNDNTRIVRKWTGQSYNDGLFSYGWMPAHPTFYARKELFERYGNYDLSYGSAADYELMLRFMHRYKVRATYLPHVFVQMRTGGISNRCLGNRIEALLQDYRAMKAHMVSYPWITVLMKPLRKMTQFCMVFNFKLN